MQEHCYLLLFQLWQLEILQNQKTSVECSTSVCKTVIRMEWPLEQARSHSEKQIALSSLQPLTRCQLNTQRGGSSMQHANSGYHLGSSTQSDSEDRFCQLTEFFGVPKRPSGASQVVVDSGLQSGQPQLWDLSLGTSFFAAGGHSRGLLREENS
jgi:hypothetical protein